MSKVRWFIDQENVETSAREQVEQTASMPFVTGLAVMPDVHYGKGSTVGTVVATEGAVMPACVGVDIGCGMIAVQTDLDPRLVHTYSDVIRDGIERRIPTGIGPYGMNSSLYPSSEKRVAELEQASIDRWADPNHMNKRAKDWRNQLGSLGGGNHFIEVCTGRAFFYGESGHLGDNPGPDLSQLESVWIILHSGSRGVGNKAATFWTNTARAQAKRYKYDGYLPNPDLSYLVENSEEYWQYIHELFWCQRFALLNREEMMDRVLTELQHTVGDFSEVERINCHHNYVSKEIHDGKKLTITRKGAILATEGTRGLIPGSMGAASYIVTGRGHLGSYCSAPHGAGRRMSRNAARKAFTLAEVKDHMEARGVSARVRESIVDEAPGAYKDIETVMFDSRELVYPTHVLKQIISVKGD